MVDFGANQMRLSLQAKRKRTVHRSTWKNGQLQGTKKKTIRANSVASGDLVRSIRGVRVGDHWGIEMDKSGDYVRYGREKGKGIPVDALMKWIKDKKLKPRDVKTGKFLKRTKSNYRAMAFMMNRSIKEFGIEPFDFVTHVIPYVRSHFEKDVDALMRYSVGEQLKNVIKK